MRPMASFRFHGFLAGGNSSGALGMGRWIEAAPNKKPAANENTIAAMSPNFFIPCLVVRRTLVLRVTIRTYHLRLVPLDPLGLVAAKAAERYCPIAAVSGAQDTVSVPSPGQYGYFRRVLRFALWSFASAGRWVSVVPPRVDCDRKTRLAPLIVHSRRVEDGGVPFRQPPRIPRHRAGLQAIAELQPLRHRLRAVAAA
jgi:hypothetical protein